VRTILITGATGGVGYAAAAALAGPGTTLVLTGRDPDRLAGARARLLPAGGEIDLIAADLADQADVRRLAALVAERHPRLDVLLNNAGVTCPRRRLTVDGLELTFAVNHLAPFLLTTLLLPNLDGGRVIGVTSAAHRAGRIDFDDLQGERRYGQHKAYNQSKLANVLFARELTARTGVGAVAVQPGFVRTAMVPPFPFNLVGFLRSRPQRPARTIAAVAAAADLAGTVLGSDGRPVRLTGRAADPDTARRLWEVSARLTTGR
jgi:NAD(P)-dependent dehydrogenase (short-subunit alcohol dehydrogenase family)